MEPTGVKPGSTLIEIEMTVDQFFDLAKAKAEGRLDDLNIASIRVSGEFLKEVKDIKSIKESKPPQQGKRQALQDKLQQALDLLERKQPKEPK